MKELEFLPEWYQSNKRRQVQVRRQYVALGLVFLAMMTFNLTATHRAGKAAAEVARDETRRLHAETVVHEFNLLTKQLNELKTKANLIGRIDPGVDLAALLAEMSHVIGESVVLRKMEILAEPLERGDEKKPATGSAVRLASVPTTAEKHSALDHVRFRIVLTGVAAHAADVPDLVCKLEESPYFQRVHPSFYGNAKIRVGAKASSGLPEEGTTPKAQTELNVTEFEITCYLANYREMEE